MASDDIMLEVSTVENCESSCLVSACDYVPYKTSHAICSDSLKVTREETDFSIPTKERSKLPKLHFDTNLSSTHSIENTVTSNIVPVEVLHFYSFSDKDAEQTKSTWSSAIPLRVLKARSRYHPKNEKRIYLPQVEKRGVCRKRLGKGKPFSPSEKGSWFTYDNLKDQSVASAA